MRLAIIAVLGVIAAGLWAFTRHRAKSSLLCFEELPPVVVTTLGLIAVGPAMTGR
jgi:hypothetical protein